MSVALTPPHAPASAVPPPTNATETDWETRQLVGAAALTWFALVAAFAIERWSSLPSSVSLGLYVVAYLAGGTTATKAAIDDLRERVVNVDLLMVTAAIGAAIIGAWAEGAMLLALFSTSNALEHVALGRTRSAVRSLMDLSPDTARRLDNDAEHVVAVGELVPGDLVVVRPGEKIPADAELVSGQTDVDQAAITGESMPVGKEPGDSVFAGTINGSGAFTARVTHPASETTISRIARLVENAQSQKSRAERFTDAFEGPYAIGVIAASILVATVPMVFGADPSDAFYRAITLLVVASPCALVISTPAATLSAIARAARAGVLVKGGSYLDELGVIDTIAFDKTGTLTIGKPVLTDLVVFGDATEDDALRDVASAEHLSEHPIARAIVNAARDRKLTFWTPESFDTDPGKGVICAMDSRTFLVGNEALMHIHGFPLAQEVLDAASAIRTDGRTAVIAADNSGFRAVVGVADQLRPGAQEAIADLRNQGIRNMVMLTGDNELVARRIAADLGIDTVLADLQPEEKLEKIQELQQSGKVAMVGDGVNDAPALATADLGIAMGAGGTDVALETADVVLITGDLSRLAFAIGLSRRMRRTIRLSIAFSLAVIAVLVTTTLFAGIPLPLGVLGHEGSTVIVVLAGLTLLGYRQTSRAPIRQVSRQSIQGQPAIAD